MGLSVVKGEVVVCADSSSLIHLVCTEHALPSDTSHISRLVAAVLVLPAVSSGLGLLVGLGLGLRRCASLRASALESIELGTLLDLINCMNSPNRTLALACNQIYSKSIISNLEDAHDPVFAGECLLHGGKFYVLATNLQNEMIPPKAMFSSTFLVDIEFD